MLECIPPQGITGMTSDYAFSGVTHSCHKMIKQKVFPEHG